LTWAAAVFGVAFVVLGDHTRLSLPIAGAALVGTAIVLWRSRFTAAPRELPRLSATGWRSLVWVSALGLVAFVLHHFRSAQQFDPNYGYHDPVSERGWGGVCKYVLQNIRESRVGLHGSCYLFPLMVQPGYMGDTRVRAHG